MSEWIKNDTQLFLAYRKLTSNIKTHGLKANGWRKIYIRLIIIIIKK